jgi:hypothetical protein
LRAEARESRCQLISNVVSILERKSFRPVIAEILSRAVPGRPTREEKTLQANGSSPSERPPSRRQPCPIRLLVKPTAAALAALGIVYGDIGTNPKLSAPSRFDRTTILRCREGCCTGSIGLPTPRRRGLVPGRSRSTSSICIRYDFRSGRPGEMSRAPWRWRPRHAP